MKQKTNNFMAIFLCLILSSLLVFVLTNFTPKIPFAEETLMEVDGKEISVTSIKDIQEQTLIQYAYYTPDEFISPGTKPSGTKIDLTKENNLAKKGTFQFVFLNLNPHDEHFVENAEALAPFLKSYTNWHFTFYLPAIFSSSVVYLNSTLAASTGSIANYDFLQYGETYGYTDKHHSQINSNYTELKFYTKRIDDRFDYLAKTITIHYEANEVLQKGFYQLPVIGLDTTIRKTVNQNAIILFVIAIITALTLITLVFSSFLKKTIKRIPQILICIGILGFTIGKYLLINGTKAPYLALATLPFSISLIGFSSILSFYHYKQKRITKFLLLLLSILLNVISICNFLIPQQNNLLNNSFIILSVLLFLIILLLCFLDIPKEKQLIGYLTPVLSAVLLLSYCLFEEQPQTIYQYTTYFLAAILAITMFRSILFFIHIENRNIYLTNNLQSEVERQTQDLTNIIDERDRLLRFLTHDLKKPVMSLKRFLKEFEKESNATKKENTLRSMETKIEEINQNLIELQKYEKLNYSVENSESCDIKAIIQEVFTSLYPDCEANGIMLKMSSPNIPVYVKRTTLISVIKNLVLNAIEHADCNQILIQASKIDNECNIFIVDNGKGINKNTLSNPYQNKESDTDNLGLGLYICQQHLATMGGSLTYRREKNKTIFIVSLALT